MLRVTDDRASIDLRLAHRWIASSYWAAGIPFDTFERACDRSLVFAAFDGARQVGFARVVTDSATFAWLCDVYVEEADRGRGAGRKLMEAVMEDRRLQGLRRFVLATGDAHGLYEKFGFERVGEPAGILMQILRPAAEIYGSGAG
jgi:GNAT superfamily N-acetyltransferase